jgi:hypothetical protein
VVVVRHPKPGELTTKTPITARPPEILQNFSPEMRDESPEPEKA